MRGTLLSFAAVAAWVGLSGGNAQEADLAKSRFEWLR